MQGSFHAVMQEAYGKTDIAAVTPRPLLDNHTVLPAPWHPRTMAPARPGTRAPRHPHALALPLLPARRETPALCQLATKTQIVPVTSDKRSLPLLPARRVSHQNPAETQRGSHVPVTSETCPSRSYRPVAPLGKILRKRRRDPTCR